LSTASAFRQHWRVANTDDRSIPLCVDLDGTLLNTDMLWESLKDVARKRPRCVLLFPFWFLQGRAHLKQQVAARANVDIAALPFHHGLVEFLKLEKARGRKLILATASDQVIAEKIAARFGLFDEVLASDGQRNLRGSAKAKLLTERFGKRGFDYAGNSHVDLQVWSEARYAIVVNGSKKLAARALELANFVREFPEEPGNPCRTPW
jgi:hydroxymethylpyrimidine pyrophosphatase-like HAD family hydrolase